MRIAVNATSLNNHLSETFLTLATLHTDHTFLFFFVGENNSGTLPFNTLPVLITPPATTNLKWQIWDNLKLSAALKKNKADIFISERFISLKTKVPQILWNPDLTYIHQPSLVDKNELGFYKKNTKKFIEKANAIVVNSYYLKNEIVTRCKVAGEKIHVIYPSIKIEPNPTTFEEREFIKEKYADGNEYFIYKGIISTEENLVNLLKAFSFFKKRQRSKMQLIITGNRGEKYEEFVHSLQSYRFKNDVKVIEHLSQNEGEEILSSSYAFVYVPSYATQADEVIEAMKCEIPLIVSSAPLLKEYCADAALFVEPEKINDIAEKMMALFKDEQKRKDLIEKGRIQIRKLSFTENADLLFKRIEETVI